MTALLIALCSIAAVCTVIELYFVTRPHVPEQSDDDEMPL